MDIKQSAKNSNQMNEMPAVGKRKVSRLGLIFISIIVLLVIAIGSSIYFYVKLSKATADPNEEARKDLQETIVLVEKHMVLPTDEEPTLATVSDPEKLSDQPFFKNAEKGDKVLLYTKLKKAILYSISKDKILEVAPFSAGAVQ